ncbi:MAG: phosphoribosylformylglycinamidine synthase subunit PurQ [Candidatus Micrarchaeota archaeon]
MKCRALVLTGYGINCEQESKFAIEKSGGSAEIVHINKLIKNPKMLEDFNFLFLPGGFSFGDDLGSGKVFSNKLKFRLQEPIKQFVDGEKLVMGVCNGFQVMVKMGLLPYPDFQQRVTLIGNDSGHFEDRWVFLKINKESPCVFTSGMDYTFLPVRHGEGKFVTKDGQTARQLADEKLVVMQYVNEKGELAGYPANPNGSQENIAGICDRSGYIFGMMPHPEAFNSVENCPYWTLGTIKEAHGLKIFRNAVSYLEREF